MTEKHCPGPRGACLRAGGGVAPCPGRSLSPQGGGRRFSGGLCTASLACGDCGILSPPTASKPLGLGLGQRREQQRGCFPCSWEHHPAPRNSLLATWRSRPSQLAKGRTEEGAGDRQSWGQSRTWQSKCDNVPKQLSLQPRPTCFQTAFCVTPTQPRAGSPSLGTKANTIDGRNDTGRGVKTAGFFAV